MRALLAALIPAAVLALLPAYPATGQERAQVQQRTQERLRGREIIPGSELMTPQEREEYRQRYAAAKTDAEREKVRVDHIRVMEERARLLGLRLADPAPSGSPAP